MVTESAGKTGAVKGIRDTLAAQRTVLANERTFLSYLRTGLTFLVGGATFIKFFDSKVLEIVGWVFIPLAVAAFGFGIYRYKVSRQQISIQQ